MTGQLRRLSVARIFRDGLPIEAPWGYVSVTPREISQAQGWVRAVIHVYPPGTTTGARRLLHLRNGAKSWAGVIALSLLIAFGGVGALSTIGIAAAIGVVVTLVVAYISLILGTRRAASRTHTVSASATRAGMSETKLFETVARQLDELDSAGHDPVQYESEWWRIYRGIEDSRRAA